MAGLFRAAAKSEEIHARNYSGVIRRMGATPALNLEPIEVRSTRENPEDRHRRRDVRVRRHIPNSSRWLTREGYGCDSDISVRRGGRAVLYQDALDNLQKVRITPTIYGRTAAIRSRS